MIETDAVSNPLNTFDTLGRKASERTATTTSESSSLTPRSEMSEDRTGMRGTLSLLEDEDEEEEENDNIMSRNPSMAMDENSEDDQERAESTFYGDIAKKNWQSVGTDESTGISKSFSHLPMCHGVPNCHPAFGLEDFDVFTRCQHPMEFLSMFDPSDQEGAVKPPAVLVPGMYRISPDCEYCGAEHTDHCTKSCQRPKSFFRKKRPPFAPPDDSLWDPETDYEIKRPRKRPTEIEVNHETSSQQQPSNETPQRQSPFMALSGFFGSNAGAPD